MSTPPRISVVIPVYNGARTLPQVLAALSQARPPPYEIVVVDDGSSDHSSAIAQEWNCRVIRLDQNGGAARAKNCGAGSAWGDILLFLDSDVVCRPDCIALVAERLDDPGLAGVVGLLDADIPFGDLGSQYKNLWMNYTYSRLARSDGDARAVGVFYTSAAAIRREVFYSFDGFDQNYHDASIVEDNDFGQRVWAAGCRLEVEPRLTVRHLKRYTLWQVLRTDFLRARALTLLRLRKWGQPFFTSVPAFFQAGVALLFLALLAAISIRGLALAVLLLVLFYALNLPFLLYFERKRGARLAAQSFLFLPIDAFVCGLGIGFALFDFARGKRY